MKFNKSFLIKIVCMINISTIVLSCSSTKYIPDDHKQQTDSNYFESTNFGNSNKIQDYKTQLHIKNLQTKNVIYFPFNKYSVLPDFFSILNMHAEFLRNNPEYCVRVEGHTDERGTPEYNIALGERRAYSVKMYLQSKGVLSEQIHTISYGKEKPIAFGHTEECYSQNRRVILLY